jgi:hypothetical protein
MSAVQTAVPRTSLLDQAKGRLEHVRRRMDAASAALIENDLAAVERDCLASYAELRDLYTLFRQDHQALDALVSMLTVTRAWCERRRRKVPEGIERILRSALEVRLRWIAGEDY